MIMIRSLFLLKFQLVGVAIFPSGRFCLDAMLRYGNNKVAGSKKRATSRPTNVKDSLDGAGPGGHRSSTLYTSANNMSSTSKRIPAVPTRALKARDWLRGYADVKGECVETFGKGPAALTPRDMKNYLNANNSEFKRRMGFALSFMCATFRSAWRVAKHLPDGVDDIGSNRRKRRGCLLQALIDFRKMMNTTNGKKFLVACDFLDSKYECRRDEKDIETHVCAWLKWIQDTKGLTPLLLTIANCASRLFLCATWTLESQACAGDLKAWANGFPTDKNIMASMSRAVRAWLRKPTSKKLLVKALVDAVRDHVIGAGTAKTDWCDFHEEDAEGEAATSEAADPVRSSQSSSPDSTSSDSSRDDSAADAASCRQMSDVSGDRSSHSKRSSSSSRRRVGKDKRAKRRRALSSAKKDKRDKVVRQPRSKKIAASSGKKDATPARARASSRIATQGGVRDPPPRSSNAQQRRSGRSDKTPRDGDAAMSPRPQKKSRAASPAASIAKHTPVDIVPDCVDATASASPSTCRDADDARGTQPSDRADDSTAAVWAPADIIQAQALHQAAQLKIIGDVFTIVDFEALIQSVPAHLRASAGIDVKTTNRARLPRNLPVVMGRIADVIRDAAAANAAAPDTPQAPSGHRVDDASVDPSQAEPLVAESQAD